MHPDAQVYYNLACAYEAENQIKQAIDNYENALSLDSNHKQACLALADIYRKKKNFRRAEIYIKKLNEPETKSRLKKLKNEQLISLCNQAINEYKQNNIKQAVIILKKVLTLDRNYVPAYKILGDIYYSRNDLSKSISYYTLVIRAGENDPVIYSNIGIMYMRLENYAQALRFLEKAAKLDSDNLNIKYSLASVLRDNKQPKKALNIYKQIVAVSPLYPNIHNDIADIYQSMGLAEKAEQEFERAKNIALGLKANGNSKPWTALSLGIALNGLNETKRAKRVIDELILKNPEFDHAYYIRARILKKLGQIKAANADLAKARELARKIKPNSNASSIAKVNSSKVESRSPINFKIDTVIKLKNGQMMKGRMKKQTDSYVVLEMDMGSSVGTITFSKQKIKEIIRVD